MHNYLKYERDKYVRYLTTILVEVGTILLFTMDMISSNTMDKHRSEEGDVKVGYVRVKASD